MSEPTTEPVVEPAVTAEVAPAPAAAPAPARPGQPRTSATGFPGMETETLEQYGRLVRRFPVAVSAEAMALAWANQEDAPRGATVVVDHEIRASGLHGRRWEIPATESLACSIVLRPTVPVEDADSAWLVAALACAEGAQAVTGKEMSTWWPDSVVDSSREQVAAVRAEVQLGPGRVKSIIITLRFNLTKLGLDRARRTTCSRRSSTPPTPPPRSSPAGGRERRRRMRSGAPCSATGC